MNVVIIDDHPFIQTGLSSIIEQKEGFKVKTCYDSGSAFFKAENPESLDLLIVDIEMPEMDGSEVIRRIRARTEQLPIIVVSMYPEEKYAAEMIKIGANGYVGKNSSSEEFSKAIDTIMNGGIYITGHNQAPLYKQFALDLHENSPEQSRELSVREREILVLICQGKINKEIAFELGLSDRTVSTYKHRLMKKLNLTSLIDLVKYGIEHNIA
jgi:DNA-binding NarL/FixJ family response regulator